MKSLPTLMASGIQLSTFIGDAFDNPKLYKSIASPYNI